MFPFSDEELKEPVLKVLDKARVNISLDGGDVKLLDIINSKVYIQLSGACVGCSASNITIKNIQSILNMDIHPELQLINIPPKQEYILEQIKNESKK